MIITYKGIDFKQTPSKHLSGKLCELSENALSKDEFVRKCKLIWGDRFNYDETLYVNSYSKIKIFDTKNDIFIEQNANSHMNGHKYNLNNDDFVFLSNIIYDNKYDYSNFTMKNVTDRVNIICPDHGEFITRAYDHLNTRNGGICNKCNFSKFNREVMKYLDRNNILYKKQYKFEKCRNTHKLPFDFYIPNIRTCIEFSEAYERLKVNDNIKNEYCEDNYIDLVRIRYDSIDNIVSILDGIFKKTTC